MLSSVNSLWQRWVGGGALSILVRPQESLWVHEFCYFELSRIGTGAAGGRYSGGGGSVQQYCILFYTIMSGWTTSLGQSSFILTWVIHSKCAFKTNHTQFVDIYADILKFGLVFSYETNGAALPLCLGCLFRHRPIHMHAALNGEGAAARLLWTMFSP